MFPPDHVKEAYNQIGLSPINEVYYHINDKQCCPMTALYLNNTNQKLDYHVFIRDIDDCTI